MVINVFTVRTESVLALIVHPTLQQLKRPARKWLLFQLGVPVCEPTTVVVVVSEDKTVIESLGTDAWDRGCQWERNDYSGCLPCSTPLVVCLQVSHGRLY